MRWMEIAWADAGVEEVSGPKANPRIIEYFRTVGRPEITSDEVAWCAAAVGYYLLKAGIPIDQIPKEKRLLDVRLFSACHVLGPFLFESRLTA